MVIKIKIMKRYVIVKNLDDHVGYKGEPVSISEIVSEQPEGNYMTVMNDEGKIWFVGEEELAEFKDLFDHPEKLPVEVMAVLERHIHVDNYPECEIMLKKLNHLGYTFDYYLDALPHNLRKIIN